MQGVGAQGKIAELLTASQLIEPPQCCYGALFGAARVVTKCLDELDVLIGAGAGELDEQATTLNHYI